MCERGQKREESKWFSYTGASRIPLTATPQLVSGASLAGGNSEHPLPPLVLLSLVCSAATMCSERPHTTHIKAANHTHTQQHQNTNSTALIHNNSKVMPLCKLCSAARVQHPPPAAGGPLRGPAPTKREQVERVDPARTSVLPKLQRPTCPPLSHHRFSNH